MSGKAALEQLWRDYTASGEYTTAPESQAVMDALGAIERMICKIVGEGGKDFLIKNESEICEYGMVCEKEGFFEGFKLATRIMIERYALETQA